MRNPLDSGQAGKTRRAPWPTSPNDRTANGGLAIATAAGRQHAKHFTRKVDAQRWLDEVTASVVTGHYVDPKAGRVPSRTTPSSGAPRRCIGRRARAHVETMLRRHAYPTLGDRPLSSILPSEVQAWVKRLGTGDPRRQALAPSTIGVVHSIVSAIFKAAVRDRRIVANPCEGTRLPRLSAQGGPADDRAGRGPARGAAGRA